MVKNYIFFSPHYPLHMKKKGVNVWPTFWSSLYVHTTHLHKGTHALQTIKLVLRDPIKPINTIVVIVILQQQYQADHAALRMGVSIWTFVENQTTSDMLVLRGGPNIPNSSCDNTTTVPSWSRCSVYGCVNLNFCKFVITQWNWSCSMGATMWMQLYTL
jgi:hypothetical protein